MSTHRQFLIDVQELIVSQDGAPSRLQPVRWAVEMSESPSGLLHIQKMRASTNGTVEDLTPDAAAALRALFAGQPKP